MRLLGLLSLVVLSLSCTSLEPAPVYIRTDYQLRCIDCQNAADQPVRSVKALDGEKSLSLDCFVNDDLLSFSLLHRGSGTSYELQVSQLRLGGKNPGSACRVSVDEGGTLYGGKLGKCTADAPTADEPCQVVAEVEDGIIEGTVYCKRLTASNNTSIWRHLVEPFGETTPAMFEIRNCTGL